MKHLGPDTLSALHDGALGEAARRDAERHLAGCAACREALAALAAADERLAAALRHDPGEGFFATFADRVTARIDAGDTAAAPAAGGPRRGAWAWLGSPRGLALAGGVAAIAVVSVLVLRQGREAPGTLADPTLAARSEQAAPPAEAPGAVSTPGAAVGTAPAPTATQSAPAPVMVSRDVAERRALARDAKPSAPQATALQAPQANATGIAPGAREDVPAGTDVPDRAREEAAPAAPFAAPPAAEQSQKATPEATVRSLKERAVGRLNSDAPGGASSGFSTAQGQSFPRLSLVTKTYHSVAWPVDAEPLAHRGDSLSAFAKQADTVVAHIKAGQFWVFVRENVEPGTAAADYCTRRIADERYGSFRLRPVRTAVAPTRMAIEDVLKLKLDDRERARWQRMLDQVQ